ncbi:IclR family transcriptional regulator [Embleya scabrispora]|uniref:IclR family transcriptional regulator n=1 Tax=Embleya scabrispora TaxID=159449 RepID=A0A1T3P6U9_9ACTN|nr:IclR family transcriptional regulator [Embleya scabrispora]OPC84665.1 IclR family transcriptional regulator [Embleya scabrispora]
MPTTANPGDLPPPEDDPPPRRGRRPAHGEPVVDRALSLLAAFDTDHRTLSLSELSRRTAMPASSVLRLANRLTAWGALERDSALRYSIGLRLLQVATLAPRGHGLRQVALPFMHDLAEVTRQHVQLAVRDGPSAMLVERLSAPHAAPVDYHTGDHLPLHSTGVGLTLLAFAPSDVQEDMLARPLYTEPGNDPIHPQDLRRTLAEIRRRRLTVFRRQDASETIVSVAAPVFGRDDTPAAALGVLVPHHTAHPHQLGLAVQTAARSISRELGAPRPAR